MCHYDKILVNVTAYVISGYCILYFIILIIHNFSWHNCKLSKDGVLTLKYVRVIIILISHYLCVHMLV